MLDHRIALVTGASRGIGLAIARILAAAGARVAMLARGTEALQQEAKAIGTHAYPISCDLQQAHDVERALEQVTRVLGHPDIVVNNAGAFALGLVGELPVDRFASIVEVNLTASYRLLSAVVPGLRTRGSGDIVTIGSVADRLALPENVAYAASKFGARGMHAVLRDELRGTGVRVSLISPSAVDTPLWDPIAPETRPGFPARAEMLKPNDVAEAVLWVVTRPSHVNIDELRLTRS